MRNSRVLEIWVGVFLLAGVLAALGLALKVSNVDTLRGEPTYNVVAWFDNVGGLKVGSPVTMAGVKIGRVSAIDFDARRFEARVVLDIARRYDTLPEDTSAKILTAGLLGEQFIGLEPGGLPDALKDGDELILTQGALVLENIIGQFLYNAASGDR